MKKRRGDNQKGFTLVELIVVLVILAILIAMLVPALTGYIRKAQKSKVLAEARLAVTAAQTFYSDTYGTSKTVEIADIKKLAEVPGEITAVEEKASVVIHLTYKNKWTVTYCKEFETCKIDGHDELYNFADGSGSSGETDPSDPDKPSDKPGDNGGDTPEGSGNGSITVGPDGNLTFTAGDKTFEQLKAEAKDASTGEITIKAGVYTQNGKIYIVTEDAKATYAGSFHGGSATSMEQVANDVNNRQNGAWILSPSTTVLKKEELNKVKKGDIYSVNNAYYIYNGQGWADPNVDPATSPYWIKLDDNFFVK